VETYHAALVASLVGDVAIQGFFSLVKLQSVYLEILLAMDAFVDVFVIFSLDAQS